MLNYKNHEINPTLITVIDYDSIFSSDDINQLKNKIGRAHV